MPDTTRDDSAEQPYGTNEVQPPGHIPQNPADLHFVSPYSSQGQRLILGAGRESSGAGTQARVRPTYHGRPPTNGFGIAGLLLGVAGAPLTVAGTLVEWLGYLGFFLSVLAIMFGCRGLAAYRRREATNPVVSGIAVARYSGWS